jgi:hypothetical protein
MTAQIETVPRHRPDLERVYWQEGQMRQFNWYAWPYTCPDCGFTGELICGVIRQVRDEQGFVRPLTETERADAFAKQRAEFARNTAQLCPRCRKRARDRGMPEIAGGG